MSPAGSPAPLGDDGEDAGLSGKSEDSDSGAAGRAPASQGDSSGAPADAGAGASTAADERSGADESADARADADAGAGGGAATGADAGAATGAGAGAGASAGAATDADADADIGADAGAAPGPDSDAAPGPLSDAGDTLQTTSSLTGSVTGLEPDRTATVILGNDGYLVSQLVTGGQAYRFDGVPPGTYFLKADVPGHATAKATRITVRGPAPVLVPVLAPTPTPATPAPGVVTTAAPLPEPSTVDLATAPLAAGAFTFHWEEDPSRSGQNQTAYVNQPPAVQFLGQTVPVPDVISADQLAHDYNIVLSDEGRAWTEEHAYRLLETLKTIPQPTRAFSGAQTLSPSKWVISGGDVAGDVDVAYGADGTTVTIADAAFTYATPRLVTVDGVRGTFYSERLHHALVQYVTHGGEDVAAVEKILTERYGCTTHVPDYAALTAPTTAETAAAFQPFHPAELVLLIDMFEEMPQGYHAVSGLKYLVRRRDGVLHPRYPEAPAVAWALPDVYPNGSYIEFMESGLDNDPDYVHRLILHEKSHFLWGYIFSAQLKADWEAAGGWYEDPGSSTGWSTTKEVEFVSAYAHQKNPDEDMAESLAYFVLDPDALRSRAPEKYAFVRDRVMHGDLYVSVIPQALTFQVLNLYPDYTYPGKIRRVDVRVDGAADEDKVGTIEIELDTLQNVFAGASSASLRLYSPIGTYVDVWLAPVDAQGSILRGTATISRYAKSGLWRTDSIVINDAVGNQRLEGVNDFGWRFLVDNALEDVMPPRYVPSTLSLSVSPDTFVEADGPHPVYRAHIAWQVDENRTMGTGQSVHAYLANGAAYSHQAWGSVDPVTSRAAVDILLTDFDARGDYGVPSILMVDAAGNQTVVTFSASPGHEPETMVDVETKTPDSQPPEVSLEDVPAEGLHGILVSAQPTHPEAPDGETAVTVSYQARDDLSGLGEVSYRLLDPQGISHFQYHYHDNFYTTFFQGDPTAWKEYTIHVVLPVGSPPGTWGLQELAALDKAGNRLALDFVETVHFDVQ